MKNYKKKSLRQVKTRNTRSRRKRWQYQEAKAKLSQVMDEVKDTGMQEIIRKNREVFYVLSEEKYEEMTQREDSLIEFFKRAPYPDLDIDIERDKDPPRDIDL